MHEFESLKVAPGTTRHSAVSWRQSLAKAALASMLGLGLGFGLAACGGGEPTDAVNSTTQGFTVVGADKASVSFSESAAAKRASQVTVRVARDSTGAPSLQADQTPLGPVYQFTPLDLADDGIEIRIPVSAQAAAHGKPVLHVATLGGEWQTVSNAKRDGEFIVAKVPSLSYATLATASSTSAGERMSRLAVSASPSAPVITSSSGAQTVLVGQTATFTVTGTGNPKPTVTWQRRHVVNFNSTVATTTSFPISEEQDWVDIDPGWTKSFYTTVANNLANSGDEYRAVLTNSQGTATSLPASLRVLPQVTAPAITTAPLSQTVQAGQTAVFTVAASGTSPLSYQWFKNGVAVVAASGTSLAIPVSAAEVGSAIQVTVQISNSAGSVTSAAATLTVVAAPPTAGGTLITAAEGGTVAGGSTGEEASLYVAPGALSADTTILLTTEPLAPSSLPAGVTAMSDIVEIKPAGLAFLTPASLSFLMKQNVPTDTGLVVVRLDANNNVLGQQARRVGVASVKTIPSLKALSLSGRASTSAITLPGGLDCVSGQFVDSASRFALSSVAAAARLVVIAVPKSVCLSYVVPAAGPVPLDTVEACDRDAQFGGVYDRTPLGLSEVESSLLNRHVDCRTSASPLFATVYVDVFNSSTGNLAGTVAPVTADPTTTEYVQVARVRYEFQMSTSGPSGVLGKLLKYRARILEYDAEGYTGYKGPAFPDIFLRPQPACYTFFNNGFPEAATATCDLKPVVVKLRTNRNYVSNQYDWSEWAEMPVKFDWTNKPDSKYDMAFFSLSLPYFQDRIAGSDAQFRRPGGVETGFSTNSNLGNLPGLRCDKGLAQAATKGCVFHEAAAVYVLKTPPEFGVTEAAEHVREAQAYGSPGKFLLKSQTRAFANTYADANRGLQRFKNSDDFDKPNNKAACSAPTSIFKTTVVNKSFSCALDPQKCQCDEYPFNSTWQGAAYERSTTSVKLINGKQNLNAGGTTLTNFYKNQRVLDLADYGPSGATLPLDGGSSDYFWVYVPLAD
jgi:hypothetical protein